jgi:hypothetical protein
MFVGASAMLTKVEEALQQGQKNAFMTKIIARTRASIGCIGRLVELLMIKAL